MTANANQEVSYLWDDDQHSNTQFISPEVDVTRTYKVTVADKTSLGCTSSATKTVVAKKLPKVTITGNAPICDGETMNLKAEVTNSAEAAGPYVYKWSTATTDNISSISFVPTTQGQQVSVEVESSNGCIGKDDVVIDVLDRPSFQIVGSKRICQGDILHLEAKSIIPDAEYTYTWKKSIVGAVLEQQMLDPGEFDFEVTAVTKGQCPSVNEEVVHVTVVENPRMSIVGESTVCYGASTTLNAQAETHVTQVNYVWEYTENGETKSSLSENFTTPAINAPLTISVTGTDVDQCKAYATFTVSPVEAPRLEIEPIGLPVCDNGEVTLQGANALDNTNSTHYEWSVAGTKVQEGALYTKTYNKTFK